MPTTDPDDPDDLADDDGPTEWATTEWKTVRIGDDEWPSPLRVTTKRVGGGQLRLRASRPSADE